MQNRRKKRYLNAPRNLVRAAKTVSREEILDLKYALWISRAKFVRGELEFEALRRCAKQLAEAIVARYEQRFGKNAPLTLLRDLSEVMHEPCMCNHTHRP
ncbi:MAG: hypothetical protein RMI34_01885 [Chloroherpetonaceae bacterium]|nr:hypothetical protein [Chloroherpetonaceae bacterium]MCS7212195.1 hypothetical protein [Chloroherpetonaceae bacterium]MDW8018807.1 hypothetical protein [Chloroherpetonaceae bacterium]MDW8467244.1 hypothetical protein [Chloroherpetonaceae bacterium]